MIYIDIIYKYNNIILPLFPTLFFFIVSNEITDVKYVIYQAPSHKDKISLYRYYI